MMKPTNELLHQIQSQKGQDLSFLKGKDYTCPPLAVYLCDLLVEHGLEKKDIIRKLELERTYGYQLFNGTRKPTRKLLIRFAVLLGLTLEETNRLLKIGGKEILYPRVRQDAAVIFVIEKKMALDQLDEILEAFE